MTKYLLPISLYDLDENALARSRSPKTCDICNERCFNAVRYLCTVCPNFNVCVECFLARNFTHQSHEFDEADMEYFLKKFRNQGSYDFLRPNLVCYTCRDYHPDALHPAWFIDPEGTGKRENYKMVLDSAFLSTEQRAAWRQFEKDSSIEAGIALFLLDKYEWDVQRAAEGWHNDYNEDAGKLSKVIGRALKGDSWMSSNVIYMSDLARAGDKGCRLCSLLYRGLKAASPTMAFTNIRVQILVLPTAVFTSGVPTDRRETNYWNWCFHPLPGVDPPPGWSGMEPAPDYGSHFASEKCFDTIRTWIQRCNTHHLHPHCTGSDKPMPRRLVCIGSCAEESILRLEEVSEGTCGRYIALSHVWGSASILRLLRTNVDQMYRSIHQEDLPKTFQDAVQCARLLNVRYLWIDSICIIQDDALDWERESSRMCQYYENAWLVVVAASAQGDTRGFLGERSAIYQGIPLESMERSGKYDMSIRRAIRHFEDSSYSRTNLAGDLTKFRAWCLQETSLARRSVIFHAAEMLWECHSATHCKGGQCDYDPDSGRLENCSDPKPKELIVPGNFGFTKGNKRRAALTSRDWPYRYWTRSPKPLYDWRYVGKPFDHYTTDATLYEEWRIMTVPLYTRRQLTKYTDKLPALSGLANLVGARTKDTYLAGIWSRDIHLGLLWEFERGNRWLLLNPVIERPSLQLPAAPSFSWASVDQAVKYQVPEDIATDPTSQTYGDVAVRLLDFSITPQGANRYGAVSGGSIKLSGLISQCILSFNQGQPRVSIIGDYPLYGKKDSCTEFEPDTFLELSEFQDADGTSITTARRSKKPANELQDFETVVDCVVIADIGISEALLKEQGTSRPRIYEFASLVLGKIEMVEGFWCYERLGKDVWPFEPDVGKQWLEQAE